MATNNQLNKSLSGQNGTVNFVGSTSPALITPILGEATGTSIAIAGGTALSKYIEGTWTPVFAFATAGNLSVSYVTQTGNYTRIGNIIFIDFTLVCTPTFTTASGNLRLTGLPVNPVQTYCCGEIGAQSSNLTYNVGFTNLVAISQNTLSYLQILEVGSSKASAFLTTANVTSGIQTTLAGSLAYNV